MTSQPETQSTPQLATLTRIERTAIIGIVRATGTEAAVKHGTRLLELGLDVIEVSLTTPGAYAAIETLSKQSDALVGVGTCLDEASTRRAIDAGATFAIAPSAAPEMVSTARRYGIPAIPAAFTPTEALSCLENGASAVKLFPASVFGPAGLSAIAEALPQIPFVATGGVSVTNATDWLNAGAFALGMGGGLLRAEGGQVQDLIRRISDLRDTAG